MSVEVDVLLQEAKESIEAAQNYRSELQQRLHGLNQARKQVPQLVCTSTGCLETTNFMFLHISSDSSFCFTSSVKKNVSHYNR